VVATTLSRALTASAAKKLNCKIKRRLGEVWMLFFVPATSLLLLAHSAESLEQVFPVCVGRLLSDLAMSSLACAPPLPRHRGSLRFFARLVHKHYGTVRLLPTCMSAVLFMDFADWVCSFEQTCRRSPGARACGFFSFTQELHGYGLEPRENRRYAPRLQKCAAHRLWKLTLSIRQLSFRAPGRIPLV
jgi:hypothetical protein